MRIGPCHLWLGAAGFHITLPWLTGVFRQRHIHRASSDFARTRIGALKDTIERGESVYRITPYCAASGRRSRGYSISWTG